MAKRGTRLYFYVTVSAAALSLGAGLLARYRSRRAAREGGLSPEEAGLDEPSRKALRLTLQYFVVPVWLAAGVADWWFHRASDIENTTGLKESVIHLLLMLEAGGPIMAALLLEVDPLILSAMIALFFLHEATAMWDVSYAVTAREVSPGEQHAHSFLELTPLLAVVLISLLHLPQLKALAGLRLEPPKKLRLKKNPLPKGYIGAALSATLVLEILPYVEEAVRDWRAHPGRFALAQKKG
jgi:hypothetical protein